jgi:hypothetical protein
VALNGPSAADAGKQIPVLTYLLYGILQSLNCLADDISLLILRQLR